MAEGDFKEPPPKPTRIRTATLTSAGGPTTPGSSNDRHSGNNSPITKVPIPPRSNPIGSDEVFERRERFSGSNTDKGAQLDPASWKDLLRDPGTRLKPAIPQSPSNTTSGITSPVKLAPVAPPRSSPGPTPPPKPKRISLAPQPMAKPVSLQSTPLQPRSDPVAQPTATPSSLPSMVASQSPSRPTNFSSLSRSTELPSTTLLLSEGASLPISPIRPSFASQNGTIRSHSAQPGHERRVDSVFTTSTPPSTSATTLFGTRSRLRSTSDTKTSPFVATAVPQSSRTFNSGSKGFHQAGSPSYGSSQSPTSDSEDYSDENQTTLTASLHKIQALAHEQTGRMKQINYSEKKADLTEAVYEKSSQWRARGAEWGGIAKKAWEERGGMGGIAGGIADRWKRKADGISEGGQDLSRSESSEPIFGLPLQDAVRISRISPSVGVPAVVTRCIEYLDIMGVEEVGLYRVPGSTSNVARLKTMFDHGLDYDFLQKGHEPQNPHDVATLLKLYLRELPAPIIPSETMPTFSNIDFTAPQQQFHKLKESLGLIPLENYILLGTLCRHLSNLADYESCTKMNISNLGLIFCPTLQIGSVLFKNLLGGDGDDEERARRLKIVWDDLDRKQEELENLEMIKEFEMGLLVVDSHLPNTSITANNVSSNNNHSNFGKSNHDGNNSAHSCTSRSQEWNRNEDRDRDRDRDDWEDVAQDVLIDFGSRPRSSDSTSRSSPPYNSLGNPYRAAGHQREPGKMSVQPIPDLYDELMSKEINEATNTPLIDFGDGDGNTTGDQEKWRRHAREPAINKRDNHSGPRIGGHSRWKY
ncbi:hypothetical protein BG006_000370 [Podila minutissima]|uniref:Rho-GAP domain-containing protein n=1 Tax=Podila minutissima TaxID=64525 RepID=A0A9P5SPF3_9FUNG|nr:hypothetical protein BG006_000370 [Podila minutissima]